MILRGLVYVAAAAADLALAGATIMAASVFGKALAGDPGAFWAVVVAILWSVRGFFVGVLSALPKDE
jgi:hypothetical protein